MKRAFARFLRRVADKVGPPVVCEVDFFGPGSSPSVVLTSDEAEREEVRRMARAFVARHCVGD